MGRTKRDTKVVAKGKNSGKKIKNDSAPQNAIANSNCSKTKNQGRGQDKAIKKKTSKKQQDEDKSGKSGRRYKAARAIVTDFIEEDDIVQLRVDQAETDLFEDKFSEVQFKRKESGKNSNATVTAIIQQDQFSSDESDDANTEQMNESVEVVRQFLDGEISEEEEDGNSTDRRIIEKDKTIHTQK